MDSGNSGSLQSSSGGDELDAACGGGADSSSSSQLAALLHHQGFGDGGSSLIYGLQDLGTPPLSSHWCSTTTAPLPPTGDGSALTSPPSLPCHSGLATSSTPAAEQAAAAMTAAASQPTTATRGSRKRPRASRRAPTTVLTTDTSNFRAMVQEFTGIPAPPFAAGGALRSRYDYDHLFPSRSSSSPAVLPQYLLRPFAHKLHAYPPPAPADSAIAASTGATAGNGYQQHLTAAEPSALLGMEDHGGINSYLSFQSTHLAGGDAKYSPLFDDDRRVAPSSAAARMQQDSSDLLVGVAHGVVMSSEGTHAHHLLPRNGDRGDELLSGLGGGCKATYSSSAPPPLERNGRSQMAGASTATTTRTTTVAATAATPPLERNGRSQMAGASTATTTRTTTVAATAAMRTQGVESWVCSTSE